MLEGGREVRGEERGEERGAGVGLVMGLKYQAGVKEGRGIKGIRKQALRENKGGINAKRR